VVAPFAKGGRPEKIAGIALERDVPLAKSVLKRHVYNELTKLNHQEKKRQDRMDKRGKTEGETDLSQGSS
jgi:hypothetical protein